MKNKEFTKKFEIIQKHGLDIPESKYIKISIGCV